ncbi:transporter substrate-binding domain-containing protein [Acrocarpospora catenulata]|uniref:transporter substrate-binding domain-containing protein n=1 Tax=Acrocarpospora catenulata TaxID=2836182 RepID=UPI001BD93F38|nr:transporter substrate-binding domain-containing protein [Acrocarpospora catenulata]
MRHAYPRIAAAAAIMLAVLAPAGCGTTDGDSSASADKPSAVPDSKMVKELHDQLPDAIKQAGVIRFAGNSSSPFRIVKGDQVTGLDPDIENALAAVLGVTAELTLVGDNGIAREGILSGRFDVANGPSFPTSDRQMFGNVTYINVGQAFLVPPQDTATKTWTDLCGKRIGAVKGFLPEDPLPTMSKKCGEEGKPEMELVGLADPNTIVLSLKAGRVDAASLNAAISGYIASTTDLSLIPAADHKQRMALLTTMELAPVFHKAFEVLFKNGDYDAILQKWGMTDVRDDAPRLNYLEK